MEEEEEDQQEEEEKDQEEAGGGKINALCCDNEPGSMLTGAPRRRPGSLSLTTFGWACFYIRNVHF